MGVTHFKSMSDVVLNKYGLEPEEGPIQKSGGYFQVPDLVFDLPLTANEKLVLIYFMRRADRAGRSFPSVERICRDCGFGSENTARKVIRSLVKAGLIHKEPVPGRSHNYFVSRELYRVIQDAKARYKTGEPTYNLSLRGTVLSKRKNRSLSVDCNEEDYLCARPDENSDRGNLMKKRDDFVSPIFAMTEGEGRVKKTSATHSEYEHTRSNNEPPEVQNMTPKEYTVEPGTEKEYTVKEEARKKKKRAHEEAHASSSLSTPIDDSDNKVTMLDVADHLHSLSPGERKEFDREAFKLMKPGEPDPEESLWQKRLLRVRYLRQLRDGGG